MVVHTRTVQLPFETTAAVKYTLPLWYCTTIRKQREEEKRKRQQQTVFLSLRYHTIL